MSNPPNEPPHFVICRCQHCDGNIEFDACDFDKGETRNAECPHCHLETVLFIPQSKPPLLPKTVIPKPTVKTPKSFSEMISILSMIGFFSWTGICGFGFLWGIFAVAAGEAQQPAITSNNTGLQAAGTIGLFFGFCFWLVIWLLGALPTFLIWFMTRKK